MIRMTITFFNFFSRYSFGYFTYNIFNHNSNLYNSLLSISKIKHSHWMSNVMSIAMSYKCPLFFATSRSTRMKTGIRRKKVLVIFGMLGFNWRSNLKHYHRWTRKIQFRFGEIQRDCSSSHGTPEYLVSNC